jgi:hypothetical protein
MNTHDQTSPAAPAPPSPAKRAYHTPQVMELGDVRELTRGSSGAKGDGHVSKRA